MPSHRNYALRRQAGLCPCCGSTRDEAERVLCTACRLISQDRTARHRQRMVAQGRCRDCSRKLDREGSRCADCKSRAALIR